ncbi:unnamed protein product [Ascophyllum nodosum]
MVALAESMIGGDRSAGGAETASAYPESAASDRNSRSSMCSTAGKGGPKLSGQKQNAVVAKIGSAVKRSSSSEKKLPFQDDDTPNTKGARVKEMEDRLARQQSAKQQASPPAKPQPFNENPLAVSTPPPACPLVPSSSAPVPSISPPSDVVPPPPTADAPHPSTPPKPATSPQPTTTPPAPQTPAPRAVDMAKACTHDKGGKFPSERTKQRLARLPPRPGHCRLVTRSKVPPVARLRVSVTAG